MSAAILPLLPIIRSDGASRWLAGSRCGACSQLFAGECAVCARCTARDRMIPVRLAETGQIHVFTVVERSFPGVAVPFIDVVVDLDDGSHLKGTLIGVTPDPATIAAGKRVRIAWREVTPPGADRPWLTYVFVPEAAGESA